MVSLAIQVSSSCLRASEQYWRWGREERTRASTGSLDRTIYIREAGGDRRAGPGWLAARGRAAGSRRQRSGQGFASTPRDHARCRASLSLTPAGDGVRLCRDHGGESSHISLGFRRMSGSARGRGRIPTGGKPHRRGAFQPLCTPVRPHAPQRALLGRGCL